MRATLLLAPLVLLAGLAAALPGPLVCAGTCEIAGADAGYVAPVTLVESGASVVFTALDHGHVTADGGLPGSGFACFQVEFNPLQPSAAVRFDVADGALHATKDGRTVRCDNAVALPNGDFELPYYCRLHTQMHATLVVKA